MIFLVLLKIRNSIEKKAYEMKQYVKHVMCILQQLFHLSVFWKKSSFSEKVTYFLTKKFPKLRNLSISVAFYDKFQTCYTLAIESFQIHNRRTWDTFTSDIISWQVRVKKRSHLFIQIVENQ